MTKNMDMAVNPNEIVFKFVTYTCCGGGGGCPAVDSGKRRTHRYKHE